jgi:hypothetical protein
VSTPQFDHSIIYFPDIVATKPTVKMIRHCQISLPRVQTHSVKRRPWRLPVVPRLRSTNRHSRNPRLSTNQSEVENHMDRMTLKIAKKNYVQNRMVKQKWIRKMIRPDAEVQIWMYRDNVPNSKLQGSVIVFDQSMWSAFLFNQSSRHKFNSYLHVGKVVSVWLSNAARFIQVLWFQVTFDQQELDLTRTSRENSKVWSLLDL